MELTVLGDIVNPDNVRMIEGRCGPGFPEESLDTHALVGTLLRRKHFEGHFAT